MDSIEELSTRANDLIVSNYDNTADLFATGQKIERLRLFEELRGLINEKNLANDEIAADVLGWAYEKLALKRTL